jgi:hypothetical protein
MTPHGANSCIDGPFLGFAFHVLRIQFLQDVAWVAGISAERALQLQPIMCDCVLVANCLLSTAPSTTKHHHHWPSTVAQSTEHRVPHWTPGTKHSVRTSTGQGGEHGALSEAPSTTKHHHHWPSTVVQSTEHRVPHWTPGTKHSVRTSTGQGGEHGALSEAPSTTKHHHHWPSTVVQSTEHRVPHWTPGTKHSVRTSTGQGGEHQAHTHTCIDGWQAQAFPSCCSCLLNL